MQEHIENVFKLCDKEMWIIKQAELESLVDVHVPLS
jgi:hypothetical protein